MTMDKSLRIRRGLIRSRSVLTRAERLARLLEAERWKAGDSPLGFPQGGVFQAIDEEEEEEEGKRRGLKRGFPPPPPPRSPGQERRREEDRRPEKGQEKITLFGDGSPSAAQLHFSFLFFPLPRILWGGPLPPCAGGIRMTRTGVELGAQRARRGVAGVEERRALPPPWLGVGGGAGPPEGTPCFGRVGSRPQRRLHRHLRHHAAGAQPVDPAACWRRSKRPASRATRSRSSSPPACTGRTWATSWSRWSAPRSPTTTASKTITARTSTSTRTWAPARAACRSGSTAATSRPT